MSEPDKQPERVEPVIGTTKDIKSTPNAGPEKTVPAAANSNEKAAEPIPTITPVDTSPKKEPVIPPLPSLPVEEAPVNDNAEAKEEVAPAAPAAETTSAQPEATAEAPAAPVETSARRSRVKGFLTASFNFAKKAAAGAAVTYGVKTAALLGAGLAGAPVWATIVISGAAVGIGATVFNDAWDHHKQGKTLREYFSKAHAKEFFTSKKTYKTLGFSAIAAMAGSALYLGFSEHYIQNWWNHLVGHAPAAVTPPVALVPPIEQAIAPPAVEHVVPPPVEQAVAPPVEQVVAPPVVHCATPVEQFTDLVKDHHVSSQVTDALHRAASTNARVSAQGVKDLAYYAHNGFGGVPKNPNVAVELFKQAADAGNIQAKVDLLYMQHYGLDGIPQNKAAALAAMQDVKGSARAAMFTKSWGGAAKALPSVKFDTGTILQGMKVGCPA